MVIFLTSSGMGKYLHAITSKYGVWESTSSMIVLQERSLMIYHIVVISQDIQILHELFSTGIQTIIFLSTDYIMCSLMNIIIIYP